MATTKKKQSASLDRSGAWPFGKKNYVLFAISLAIIVVGFVCLGSGDDANDPITLTVAPILLVLGYGMLPFAIVARGKKDDKAEDPA